AVLDDVLAEDHLAAEHGAGDLVLGPADGAVEHVAEAGRGGHGRLERAEVHPDVDDSLVHLPYSLPVRSVPFHLEAGTASLMPPRRPGPPPLPAPVAPAAGRCPRRRAA